MFIYVCYTFYNGHLFPTIPPSSDAYPWIALLAYQLNTGDASKFLCAGSLISQRYVITTAHCINEQLQFVRLGEYDLASDTDGAYPLDVLIEQRILHEGYVANLILNDIALLRLAVIVPISGYDHNAVLNIISFTSVLTHRFGL